MADAEDAELAVSAMNVITEWNHGAERLDGYSSCQAIGRSADICSGLPNLSTQDRAWPNARCAVTPFDYTKIDRALIRLR